MTAGVRSGCGHGVCVGLGCQQHWGAKPVPELGFGQSLDLGVDVKRHNRHGRCQDCQIVAEADGGDRIWDQIQRQDQVAQSAERNGFRLGWYLGLLGCVEQPQSFSMSS